MAIYGMSSFPLTFIFFKMVLAPPTRLKQWGFPEMGVPENTGTSEIKMDWEYPP
jgi:hypothetical protein